MFARIKQCLKGFCCQRSGLFAKFLRTLCALGVSFVLSSPFLYSATFSSSYSFVEYQNQGALFGEKENSSVTNQSFLFQGDQSIADYYTLSVGARVQKNDYSQLTVRNQLNEERPVLFNQYEGAALLALSYSKGAHLIGVNGEASFGEVLSPYKSIGAQYAFSLYNQTTIFGIGGSALQRNKRRDYFLDFDFALKKRPERQSVYSAYLSVEQVFNRFSKGKLKLSRNHLIRERSPYWGIDYTQYLSWTDRLYSAFSAAYFKDQRTDSLKDARGYFDSYSLRADINYEAVYDFWIHAAYTLSVQKEKNFVNKEESQIGADTYELGVSYDFSRVKVLASGVFQKTNTKAQSFGSSASLEVEI